MKTRRRLISCASTVLIACPMLVITGQVGGAVAAPLGGPVILGGDDLTDHGHAEDMDNNGTCETPREGWNYIYKALSNIAPQVTRSNDGSVAALGSSDEAEECLDGQWDGGAGAAIKSAAARAGISVTFHNGADAINDFFAAAQAGTANPRIVWIAGTGASNDLESEERQALADNATSIGDFVNSGGGLMSHGVAYEWLAGLLPGVSTVDSGSSDDLYLTPAGTSSFPGLTNEEINAGPWHNHFECTGDPGTGTTSDCFGGLDVLTASGDEDDNHGLDAAVILGGAAAQLPGSISLTPGEAFNNPTKTPTHSVEAVVRDDSGAVQPGKLVTFTVISGPNNTASGTDTTDAGGKAHFTYTSNGVEGTDTIRASFVDDTGQTRSIQATKVWDKTRATCVVVARRTAPRELELSVQDPLSGIQTIGTTPSINATVTTDPASYQGSTSAIKIVVSRIDQTKVGRAKLTITDRSGNVSYCTISGYVSV